MEKKKPVTQESFAFNDSAPCPTVPVPAGPIPAPPPATPRNKVTLTVDGKTVQVPEGSTLLEACRTLGIDTPTLCFLENLNPVNVCRVCVVELEGARTLVPACSRPAENGMVIRTDSERVRLSRRMVLEFLASSVDVSTAPELQAYLERYGGQPERYGPAAPAAGEPETERAGAHCPTDGQTAATVAQPVKIDNDLYIRDYGKCILCYKCVKRAVRRHRTPLPSPWPAADSTAASPPNTRFRSRIPPVSIAETASGSVPPEP